MAQRKTSHARRPLLGQLGWFIRLRWLAGVVVLGSAVVMLAGGRLGWFARDAQAPRVLAVGLTVLAYNAVLWWVLRRISHRSVPRVQLVFLAWTEIILDLGCLTLLTLGTGGIASPLLGFYVFHMVFASLLLPRAMAFGGAGVALVMVNGGLYLTRQYPATHEQSLILIGWACTLVMTVYVANAITRDLRRHRRRLVRQNRRVRAMTRQLARHQVALVQHEKMVGLGQMAAGVAHEIANPLASMDSVLQLMQRKPDRVRPENLSTLRQQVERIHQIVRQMTAFAHPTDNQWQTVPVNNVVEEALRMVRLDNRVRKVVAIEVELGADVGALRILPHALQQVLVNLMLNGLDAMADVAEPKLKVRTARQEHWCTIAVTDNGHGIRSEHLRRLFEPFFTTKPVGKGTGLGLSISYSLVRKQGGEIEVESKPGAGATFTVRLPARDWKDDRLESPQAAAADAAPAKGDGE